MPLCNPPKADHVTVFRVISLVDNYPFALLSAGLQSGVILHFVGSQFTFLAEVVFKDAFKALASDFFSAFSSVFAAALDFVQAADFDFPQAVELAFTLLEQVAFLSVFLV